MLEKFYPDACLFEDAALFLDNRFEGIVTAFDVHFRFHPRKEVEGSFIRENAYGRNAFQSGQHQSAILFVVYRAAWTFDIADPAVTRQPNQKCIALVARGFQVAGVADVQDVKATIGDYQPDLAPTLVLAPIIKLVPGNNFVPKMHAGNEASASRISNALRKVAGPSSQFLPEPQPFNFRRERSPAGQDSLPQSGLRTSAVFPCRSPS